MPKNTQHLTVAADVAEAAMKCFQVLQNDHSPDNALRYLESILTQLLAKSQEDTARLDAILANKWDVLKYGDYWTVEHSETFETLGRGDVPRAAIDQAIHAITKELEA